MNLKTLSDLWHANNSLKFQFEQFIKEVEDYKNQKLVKMIIATKYRDKKLEDFSPEEREEFTKFLWNNCAWLEQLVEYYND